MEGRWVIVCPSIADGTGAVITFTGKLQSADAICGPWNEVPGATKQYAVPASSGAKFYRAAE